MGRTNSRWALAAIAIAWIAGCHKGQETASSSVAPSPPGAVVPSSAVGHPSIDMAPEALEPVIHELGADNMVPEQVVIELSSPIVGSDQVKRASTKTELVFSPDVPGTLVYTSPSTLTFTPKKSFAFSTTYQVTLAAVETASGVIRAPKEDAWSYAFTTPGFSLLRASTESLDLGKGRLEASLVFSGPPGFDQVKRFASWKVGGKAPRQVAYSRAQAKNEVVASLEDARLSPKSRVELSLAAGLPAAHGGSKAGAAQLSLRLFDGPALEIKSARVKEGTGGPYIEIVCDDAAAPGEMRRYWDDGEEEYLHSRCVLSDAEAQAAIHFKPAAKFYVAPARRGFSIFGDFKRGTYALTIDAGATSIDRGVLQGSYAASFSVAARKPQIGFLSSGRYLPRSAWKNLAIRHLNVDQVELTVRQVPPENLVFWMSDDQTDAANERNSNVILEKTLSLRGQPDTLTTSWVDVGGLLPASSKGILELTLSGGGARATARLLLTDMGLLAKRSAAVPGKPWAQEVFVWAMDIDSTELLSGVEVSLLRKSGKAVARCTTSGEDGCRLQVTEADADESAPFALIARKGDDLTYLKYADLKTEIADSDVQGEPYHSDKAYRAAVYTDRGVYRPGDVAHVAAIVRGKDDLAPPAGLPVQLELVDPRQRVAKRMTLATNEGGLVSADLPFAAFADTGKYELRLEVANEPIGAQAIDVEEFVPERMKVAASVDKPGYALADAVPVAIDAKYLFGGSAEGSEVELDCTLEPTEFKPKDNGEYHYAIARDAGDKIKPLGLGQVKGALDEKGHALLTCPALTSAASYAGAARLVAHAAVFEAGSGRSTQAEVSAPVHPEAYYLGLEANAQKAEAGKPFQVSGVVVGWAGALLPAAVKEVEVELFRMEAEYGYFYDEEAGGDRYQRTLRPVSEGRQRVAVKGGRFSFQVTPHEPSSAFRVKVKQGNAETDLQLEGEHGGDWWWGDGDQNRVDQTPRPMKPTALAVSLPAQGKVGEPIAASIRAPYKGRVLFTAETSRVIAAEWVQASAGEVRWTFKPKAFAPNVYVSAFLVKDPHLESKESYLPDRAFGVGSVAIEPTELTQGVKLTAPKEVRSNSELEVTLDLGKLDGPTYATVAAVDEGILQLTHFKSPDPLAAIFSKRALGVETFETVGWTLLVPPAGATRSTGGDAEAAGGQGRVQPVKPVALWSGVVKVPESGRLEVSFPVPQYRGQLRVMAVTAGPKKLGRASTSVTVKDPLVLETTLPRFLSEGDAIQIPVFVTNLSGGPLAVKVSLSSEPIPVPGMEQVMSEPSPLQLLGKPEGTTSLADGHSSTLVFQARATKQFGAAKLRVVARGGGFESRDEVDVPFYPSGPKSRVVQKIPLAAGTLDLKPLLKGWMPTSEKTTFWVTSNPYGEAFEHLGYLIDYPYGCIEQTTSSTRPLLFVRDLIHDVDPTLVADQRIEDMVMHGVNRIFSMQTPSGGFAYWPGETEPNAWGTAYAAHLLLDATKLGYAVPQDRLGDALTWMENELNAGADTRRQFHHGDDFWSAEAYMELDLALAGRGRKAEIQKRIDELPQQSGGESHEERTMLEAALYSAGDRRYESDLKSPDASPLSPERFNRWDFYSDLRRRGFLLSTFQDLFGNDPAGEALAQRVADGLRGKASSWYTTQEIVWGVTGLGKRVQGASKGFEPPVLLANGKPLPPAPQAAKSPDRTWAVARASEIPSLKLKLGDVGKGQVYLVASSEGVREGGAYELGGHGLELSRRYLNAGGKELDLSQSRLTLAELVYVELTLSNTSGDRVQNIALVDRLPAGLEIENPRLGHGTNANWLDPDALWKADAMNVRDDRIEVFGALDRGETRKVVCAVRAVTAGKFTLPTAEAGAMYDPEIWARVAPGRVTVDGPWKDYLL